MPVNRSDFIVFDLDDTLFHERDYQLSGFRAVTRYCKEVYGTELYSDMLAWYSAGEKDIFGRLCSELGLPESCKESFLWVYRNHFPDIFLDAEVKRTIHRLLRCSVGVAVLTDGRSVTQRLKIKTLGLSELPVFISEEWGDKKPGQIRYSAIQKEYPAETYWYIGDNPSKDFLAPNQLGWTTVGLRDKGWNIHTQNTEGLSNEHLPDQWIQEFCELDELLC